MNTISLQEHRRQLAAWRERLDQGGRGSRRLTRELLSTIGTLLDDLDAAQAELRRRDDYTAAYGALVNDWNPLVEGLRALGVEVSQPASVAPGWRWQWGAQHGDEPTIPAAYLAGLRAAGVVRRFSEGETT